MNAEALRLKIKKVEKIRKTFKSVKDVWIYMNEVRK